MLACPPAFNRLAAAAQNIENSLGNIKLIADLLLHQYESLPEPMRREYLGVLAEKASRLRTFAEDLSELARLQTQPAPLESCDLHVSEIVLQTIEALGAEAACKQVTVRSAVAEEEPRIPGDYWKLSQALGAILARMISCTPPGGTVAVNIEPAADAVQIVFRRLASLPPPDLASAFFAEEEQDGADALRLALSEELISLHGGTLSMPETESGQSVIIRLPGVRAAAAGQ
jgi:signal transduction histidine kinase